MAKLRRLLSLWGLYARMDLHWFIQDRFCCILCILSDLLSNIAAVSGILLLAVRFQGVGGFSSDEILFMLGFFTLADGLSFMFTGGFNVSHISRRIGRGQVDHMIMQPVPLWMQLMTEGFLPVSGNAAFFLGVILTATAVIRLHLALSVTWFLALLVYLICRMAVMLGASFWVGSRAFYRPASCEELSSLVYDLANSVGKYPLFGLPLWLTQLLVTVFPIGLMAWFPSLLLLGKLDQPLAGLLPVAVALAFASMGILYFQKGLRYYVKHGCNRYSNYGHRG